MNHTNQQELTLGINNFDSNNLFGEELVDLTPNSSLNKEFLIKDSFAQFQVEQISELLEQTTIYHFKQNEFLAADTSGSSNLLSFGGDGIDELYLRVNNVNNNEQLEYSLDGTNFTFDFDLSTTEIEPYILSPAENIAIDLQEGDDRLIIDQSLSLALDNLGITLTFDGGAGEDSLFGSQIDSLWQIDGDNSGTLNQQIQFNEVENLIGNVDNDDTFILKESGSLSGILDGGDRGYDVLEIEGTKYQSVVYTAFDSHSGTVNLDGKLIEFAGLEPVTIGGDASDVSIDLSQLDSGLTTSDDQASLLDAATSGQITLRSDNGTFEHTTFNNPTSSLSINLGGGDDSLTIESLDTAFSADLTVTGDDGDDSVTFASDLFLNGGNLEITTETVTVNDGVTISTRQVVSDHVSGNSTGDSGNIYFIGDNPLTIDGALVSSQPVETITVGDNAQLLSHVEAGSDYSASDIWLNARYFSNSSLFNLLPVNYSPLSTSIDIGANALLKGNNIIIKAQAEDKSFAELTGADANLDNFVISPLESRISEAVALPVKVLVNKSDASVTVNSGATLEGLAGVSVEAVATATPSGNAKGELVSIGYTHAESEATVDILGTATITAGEAVKIGSEGNATSSITTETEGTNSSSAGFSFAVDYANIVSHTTVETDVTITAGKSANIVALGNKETEANATSTTGQSGLLSLGFGVNISDVDIKSDVDGTVTANQNTGAIVKLELNPLKEVTYEFNPSDVIDTSNNTLTLSNDSHALRTGDKITYNTNEGSAIAGLTDAQDYYVVIDPDNADLIYLTNSREDAFDVATALEANDTATVTSTVVDLTGIGSLQSTSFSASGIDNDGDTLTLTTSNALEIGQAVVYDNGGNADISGLVDGQTYYVITYSYDEDLQQQVLQLAASESDAKAGTAIDLDASGSSGNHSLARLQQLIAQVINVDTDTIDLAKVFGITDASVTPHALATGDQVNYANRRGTSIGGFDQFGENAGLVDGQDYFIVTDPNNPNVIRLAVSELEALEAYEALEADPFADLSSLVIDINNGVTDSEGNDVVAAVNVKSFDPTELGIVDDTTNSIILDNEAFTGDDFFGSDPNFSLLGSTFELGQAVIYNSNGGKPIGGLSDGTMYYIGTAVDENNLSGDNRFVSKQTIQLAETENKARAGVFLDIDPTVATGTAHSLTATHVIDSGLATGVGVLAQLTSSDKAVGTSEMKEDVTDTSGTASFDIFDAAGKIFSGLVNNSDNGNYADNSNAGGNNSGGSSLALGGALGFVYADHDVLGNVGSNAVLKSGEDLEVQGTVEHQIQINADSDVDTSADSSGSAAVVVGVLNNDADAIVNSNAQLDAYRATRVIADVSYPYLTRPDEFVPANLGELVDLVKTEGYDAINDYMDGTLGLKSNLLNTWARSTASADNVGASGSVNVLVFNNDTNAIVKSDALINQDLAWRANSENQTVSVEAKTSMQMLNLTGVFNFSLPTLEVGLGTGELSSGDLKLLGADGKTGIGGAFFLMFLNNNTKALVEDGVEIYNGFLGGFNMKAREAIMNFNFTQAGSKGTSYGIAGTFGYVNHNSNTIARLSGGASVEGRSATIFAGNLGTHINWAGSVAVGGNVGFGITVAINELDRQAFAVIGDFDDTNLVPAAVPNENTYINVTDGVKVNALSDGWMGAFSVAAAVADGNPATSTTSKTGDLADGGSTAGQTTQPTSAIGLSGDVSYNLVDDTVHALIYDAGILQAAEAEFNALNETDFYSVAGAVAFTNAAPGKTSVGLAGSASWNEIIGDAQAYIEGQGTNRQLELRAKELQIDAEQTSSVFAITAGGSGAFGGQTNVALAGSFSYNKIDNTTSSYMDGVDATLSNALDNPLPVVVDSSNIASDDSVADKIIFDDTHGWATGTAVIYDNGGESDIGGLTDGNTYYVVADDRNGKILQLATNADGTGIVDLDPSTTTGEHRFYEASTATSTEVITFNTDHGWSDGDLVTYVSDGDAVGGLTDGAEYYVVLDGDTDDNSIKLSSTQGGAAIALDFTAATGDSHSIYQTADDDNSYELFGFDPAVDNSFDISQVEPQEKITLGSAHNFATGQAVVYDNGGGTSIGGLTQGKTYYVIADDTDPNSFRLATAETQAKLEFAITLDPSVMSGTNHQFLPHSNLVNANDETEIFAVAGTATLSLGAGANTGGGIGFGFGWNDIDNTTTAYIADSTLSHDNSLQVLAGNNSTIQAISASIGVSSAQQTAGTIAGTASVNFIDNVTEAYLSNVTDGADGDSSGLVRVVAEDAATIQSLSGAISVAISGQTSLGFGAAVAYNAIGTQSGHRTSAYASNSTLYLDSLDITATGEQTIQSLSGSLAAAASGNAAISAAGAVSINLINDTSTTAYITGSPTVLVDNAITILARNEATIQSLAGQAAIAVGSQGGGALGASVAINEIDKTSDGNNIGVYAYIDDSDVTSSNSSISLNALSESTIETIAAGVQVAVGASFGGAIGGSVAINTITSEVDAHINNNATVIAAQAIEVKSDDESSIQALAGQVGIAVGQAAASIGAAIAENDIQNKITSYIDGATVTSNNSTVTVNALSTAIIETLSAVGAVSAGQFAGSAAVPVSHNQINNVLDAHISNNSLVTAQEELAILATDDSTIRSLSGGAAISVSLGVGVGVAYAYNNIDNETKAYSANATLVSNNHNIELSAESEGTIETLAASFGASGITGVAGSIAYNEMANQTWAYADGGSLTAEGSVGIFSQARNDIDTKGGSFAVGTLGVGGTVVVNEVTNQTIAETLNDAQITARGQQTIDVPPEDPSDGITTLRGLGVVAINTEDIDVLLGTASVSFTFGLSGTVLVNTVENTTQASIDGGTINSSLAGAHSEQSVLVKAFNDTNIDDDAGAVALGGSAGLGVSVDVSGVKNTTTAYIGNDTTVNAQQDVSVDATSHKNVDSTVVAGSGSFGLAVGGAVSILNLGSALSSNGNDATGIDETTGNNETADMLEDQIDELNQEGYSDNINIDYSVTDELNTSATINHATQAYIGTGVNINVGNDINVESEEITKAHVLAGAISAAAVGIGGSVGIVSIDNNSQAFVGAGSQLDAGGDIAIDATGEIGTAGTLTDDEFISGEMVETYTGAAGFVGLGAAVSYVNTNNNTTAYIDSSTTNITEITNANNLDVLANSTTDLTSKAMGAAAGALAVGVVISEATETGTTSAYLGSGIAIGDANDAVNNLTVQADSTNNLTVDSTAAAAGIVSGSGSVAEASATPIVRAEIGDNAQIDINQNLDLKGEANGTISADAYGVNIGGISVGVSSADAQWNPAIDTTVGQSSLIAANGTIDIQGINDSQVTANATSATGSLVGGTGSLAEASANSTVQVDIGQSAELTALQTVLINAQSSNITSADADGYAFGVAAAGVTKTESQITDVVSVVTGQDSVIDGNGDVTLIATSDNNAQKSKAYGGSGGIVAGASTEAIANVDSNTTVTVGTNSQITSETGTLTVEANNAIEAHSEGDIETGGAVTFNQTKADTDVTANTQVTIDSSAQLQGQTVDLTAQVTKLDADADSYSKTFAADSTTQADAFLDVTSQVDIVVATDAEITAIGDLALIARQDGVDTDSDALAAIGAGVTGVVEAEGHNDLDLDSDIDLQTGSQLAGENVDIEAESPHDKSAVYSRDAEADAQTVINYIVETIEVVEKVTKKIPIIGWIVKWVTKTITTIIEEVLHSDESAILTGDFISNNSVTFNGDILQGSALNPQLTVNADYSFEIDGDITAQVVGDDVVVDEIANDSSGNVLISAEGGTVSGDGTIHKNGVFESITLINNSDKNLQLNNISVVNRNPDEPDVNVIAETDNSNFSHVTDVTDEPLIDIDNNLASNVIFAGEIDNATGIIDVLNQGGDLINLAGASTAATQFDLNTPLGNIGESDTPLNLLLYKDVNNPTLSADAGGDIYLATQLLEIRTTETEEPEAAIDGADISGISAGSEIEITAAVSQASMASADPTTEDELIDVASSYYFSNIASTGADVTLTLDQNTDLYLNGGLSAVGTVSLITPGAIFDNDDSGFDISGGGLLIQADTVDALETAVNALEAAIAAGDFILENTGALTIGGISDTDGVQTPETIQITTFSPLTVTENVSATGDITLTATDSASVGDDLTITASAVVTSTTGNIFLQGGDDITIERNGSNPVIQAAGDVLIEGDYGDADPDVGSVMTISGEISAASVTIWGNSDDDIVDASEISADLLIEGFAGDDYLASGSGEDTLIGGEGSDTLDGGDGTDIVTYKDATAGVYVNLATGRGYRGESYGDRFINIENLEGSEFDDIIKGDNEINLLIGLGGKDRIFGYAGDDTIEAGQGADIVRGGYGDDYIDGGEGDDSLLGDQDNDILIGGLGDDFLRDFLGDNIFGLSADDGTDTIVDFGRSNNLISLLDGLSDSDLELIQVSSNTHIIFNNTILAILLRVSPLSVIFTDLLVLPTEEGSGE